MPNRSIAAVIVAIVVVLSVGYLIGRSSAADGLADAQEISPTEARDRDFYAPNSEDLAPDEMRLIACGTGMPTARPKQAASCWLLELGNGDKFLFDVGTGSAERIGRFRSPTTSSTRFS
jgi:hypothetical protein